MNFSKNKIFQLSHFCNDNYVDNRICRHYSNDISCDVYLSEIKINAKRKHILSINEKRNLNCI